ncbi:hypothetical protein EV363DRAFT_1187931 [Boletus edulis]|nr:hypothetical protein EV363DRAFT_1187931 [Boletus edulis]
MALDNIHARNYRRAKIIDDRQCVTGVKRLEVPSVQQRSLIATPDGQRPVELDPGKVRVHENDTRILAHRDCTEKAWVNVVDLDPRGTAVSHQGLWKAPHVLFSSWSTSPRLPNPRSSASPQHLIFIHTLPPQGAFCIRPPTISSSVTSPWL